MVFFCSDVFPYMASCFYATFHQPTNLARPNLDLIQYRESNFMNLVEKLTCSQVQPISWPWDVDRICVLLLRELDRCWGWRTRAEIISLGRPQSSQELRLVRTYGSPSWVPDVKGTILTDKIICFLLIKNEFQCICQLISWASAPGLPRIPRWGLFLWGDPAAFLLACQKGPVS